MAGYRQLYSDVRSPLIILPEKSKDLGSNLDYGMTMREVFEGTGKRERVIAVFKQVFVCFEFHQVIAWIADCK